MNGDDDETQQGRAAAAVVGDWKASGRPWQPTVMAAEAMRRGRGSWPLRTTTVDGDSYRPCSGYAAH